MSNGKKRARRFLNTIKTINEKDMVRDAKTGKEMSYKQYRKLEDKQNIDEDKKEFPRVAKKGYFGEPPKKNRFGKQVQQREDKSVFDYQTKGKPIKKIVGKIKRAMGMSGLKLGGKTIPEGPEGAGLRALKAKAPEVTSQMGYKKKGGIVEGINNIKGMKNGGVCRGMGAETKGGSFNVSGFGYCMCSLWVQR